MQKSIFVSFLSLFISLVGYSQAPPSQGPQITPLAPEAASLGRYGDIAVGEYTGTPNISIPLHTVKSGQINYPLTLSFNASGIKVAQEATWVGLGWDVTGVSAIAYVPVGGNDRSAIPHQSTADWATLIDYINPQKIAPAFKNEHWPWQTDCSGFQVGNDLTPSPVIRAAAGPEGAVDLYSVNCLDLSFKFYIHRLTNEIKIYGDKSNFKIEKYGDYNFLITDGDGVRYYFLEQEWGNGFINNWYLTAILRPDGELLKFKYQNFGAIEVIPSMAEQNLDGSLTVANELGYNPKRVVATNGGLQNLYLTEIESLTEIVDFHLSAGRTDLKGGGRQLDSITVTDKFSNQGKVFAFEYGYFNASTIGGNYLNGQESYYGVTTDQLTKRLKLISLTEKDTQSKKNKKYSFEYQEGNPLPYKTSFSVDHWGNYNGADNNTFLPALVSVFSYDYQSKSYLTNLDSYAGGMRGADADYITSGVLKSITYPTGGKTEFTFEPHHFYNYTVLSADDEANVLQVEPISISDLNDGTSSGTSKQFDLTFQQEVSFMVHFNNKNGTFNYSQIQSSTMTLVSVGPNGTGILKTWHPNSFVNGSVYSETFNEKIVLPVGSYLVQIGVPDNLGFQGYTPLATATINYRKYAPPTPSSSYESIGGGLRIKEIKNFDSDGKIISSREYQYTAENGSASGKLIIPLRYTEWRTFKYCTNPGERSCVLGYQSAGWMNSGSSLSLSTSPIRASVGYDRVTIIDKDLTGLAKQGKTIKTFTNSTGMGFFFYDIMMNDAPLNGDPMTITYLNDANSIVRIDSFKYQISAIEKAWINVKSVRMFAGPVTCQDGTLYGLDSEGIYVIGVYPYVSFKKLMTNKIEVEYTPTGNFRKESVYQYNMNNFAVSEISTVGSDKVPVVTQLKYPHDFSSDYVYSLMIDANMTNPVVEEIKLKNGVFLERTKTNYGPIDNSIKPVTVERQIRNGSTETVMTYEKYVEGRTIAEYKGVNGVSNSFIWKYNETLPVAWAENAQLKDIFYNGFEDGDGNSQSEDCKTGHLSHTGAISFALTNLTNGPYILTYWLKSGNAWTLQTVNVNVTTGAYTIAFASGQQVDDVRFYPASATMTTYTYDPLFGLTSSTDKNNSTTYYQYDSFGRLEVIKDSDKKIVKQNLYHYLNLNQQ